MYYFLVLKVNMNKRFINIWRQYRHLIVAFRKIAIKAQTKFSQTYVGYEWRATYCLVQVLDEIIFKN